MSITSVLNLEWICLHAAETSPPDGVEAGDRSGDCGVRRAMGKAQISAFIILSRPHSSRTNPTDWCASSCSRKRLLISWETPFPGAGLMPVIKLIP